MILVVSLQVEQKRDRGTPQSSRGLLIAPVRVEEESHNLVSILLIASVQVWHKHDGRTPEKSLEPPDQGITRILHTFQEFVMNLAKIPCIVTTST